MRLTGIATCTSASKPLHGSLSSSKRLMRVFGAVVEPKPWTDMNRSACGRRRRRQAFWRGDRRGREKLSTDYF